MHACDAVDSCTVVQASHKPTGCSVKRRSAALDEGKATRDVYHVSFSRDVQEICVCAEACQKELKCVGARHQVVARRVDRGRQGGAFV